MLDETKYIVFKRYGEPETPIIFPAYIEHASMVPQGAEAKSGGFVNLYKNEASCYGESLSLGLKSREKDNELINELILLQEKDSEEV